VLLIKLMGLLKMFFFDKPVITGKNFYAYKLAYMIINRISYDGSYYDYNTKNHHIEFRSRHGGNSPCSKKKRITGKKWGYDKACFAEYNQKQYGINPPGGHQYEE
jgi:hypothetical protein